MIGMFRRYKGKEEYAGVHYRVFSYTLFFYIDIHRDIYLCSYSSPVLLRPFALFHCLDTQDRETFTENAKHT